MKHLSHISLFLLIMRNLVSMPKTIQALSSPSVFQTSLCECVSILGPAAAPVRWRTATWQPFAVRLSRRCGPTVSNSSTWLLDTSRPTKVRQRNGAKDEGRAVNETVQYVSSCSANLKILCCGMKARKDSHVHMYLKAYVYFSVF